MGVENKTRGVDVVVVADVVDAVVVRARKMRSDEEKTCEAEGRKTNWRSLNASDAEGPGPLGFPSSET